MNIAQHARSFPIVFSTLLIGLSPLIPVPVVDDLLTASFCRWRVKSFAARHGLILNKEEIKILADEQQVGCFAGFTLRTFGYLFKEFWQNLLPFLEAGRAVNLLSRTYYYGVLLDYAFSEGLYKGGDPAEAQRLSHHIHEVRKGVNLRQLKALFRASGTGTRKLSLGFIRDISERYFKNILVTFKKGWRQLRRQKGKFDEEADQAAENLNESAGTWAERYKLLFEEFYNSIAKIPDKELEELCLALRAKMTGDVSPPL